MNIEKISDFLALNDYVIVDIETTGLSMKKGGRLIQIAALKIKDGKIIDTFNEYVYPQQQIPKKITEITGITNDDVYKKKVYGSVMQKFYRFLNHLPMVFHNAAFDWERFIKPMFYDIGKPVSHLSIYCSLLASRKLEIKRTNHKLEQIKLDLGMEEVNSHDALNDCKITHAYILYLQNKYKDLYPNFNREDIPLHEKVSKKEYIYPYHILRVSHWSQRINKKTHHYRLYVLTNIGSVYYDQVYDAWYRKDMKGSIDFYELEKRVLSYLNMKDRSELKDYRDSKMRKKREVEEFNMIINV